jgi:glycosyltransferase involved in cell wall biosynthesis
MISVLTLTYQRHHLLEEAIESFLQQTYDGPKEMVIINDSPDVQYVFTHPDVRIINCPERFSSVGKKLQWGFTQCNSEFIYRLDDDDLLAPWALELQKEYQKHNIGYDIYRCQHHYYFLHNKYQGLADSINNGNCYRADFINNIEFPDASGDEDNTITFHRGGTVFTGNTGRYSMIYRWGMSTYHISGMGHNPTEEILRRTDASVKKETGVIYLQPKFLTDYYGQLPK